MLNNATQVGNTTVQPRSLYITEPYVIEVLRLIFVTTAAVIGVMGSIFVCLLAPTSTKARSAGSLYIRSLAVADVAILVVNFPIAVIKEQSPLYWPLGKEVCYVFYPLMELFHGACIWSIVAIAVERYRGIIHSHRQAIKSIRITVAVIWTGSFVLLVAPLLFYVRYVENPHGTFCGFAWPSPVYHAVYNSADAVLLYVLPLVIISFTYVRITREINVSSLLHKRLSLTKVRRGEEIKRVKQNARTKKLLTPLVVIFTITMLPVNVFRVLVIFWESFVYHELFLIFYNVCVIGVVINSAADPIIYSIVTKGFHARLKAFISNRSSVFDRNSATFHETIRETDV